MSLSSVALAALLLVVALAGLVVVPYATGQGMNVITEMGSQDDLARYVLIGFIASAVYLLFSFIANRMFAKLAAKALYGVQTSMFNNVQTLSMGFFFRNPPGELSSKPS